MGFMDTVCIMCIGEMLGNCLGYVVASWIADEPRVLDVRIEQPPTVNGMQTS